jgi:hypothetical protein
LVSEYISIENKERQNLMKMLIDYSKKMINLNFCNIEKNEETEDFRMHILDMLCADYAIVSLYLMNTRNNSRENNILSFFSQGGCLDWFLTIFSVLNPYEELTNLSHTFPSFTFYPSLPKHSPYVSEILWNCSLAVCNVMKTGTPSSVIRYMEENNIFE